MSLSAIITKNIDIDFYDDKYILVNAKQYDGKSRYINVTCYNRGKIFNLNPVQHTVYVKYEKADKNTVFNFCTINTQGQVLVELTKQMLAASGMCYVDLVVINKGDAVVDVNTGKIITVDNAEVLGTMKFNVYVYESAVDNSLIESSDEYTGFTEALAISTAGYDKVMSASRTWALTSQSWAIGNSGVEGRASVEDTDNSQYYSKMSRSYALGDIEMRSDESTDNSEYYSRLSKSYAVGDLYGKTGTASRDGEGVDNAEYYSRLAKSYALGEFEGSTGTRDNEAAENAKTYMETAKSHMDTTESYMDKTEGYMKATDGYMKTTEEYMNTVDSYMKTTQGYMETTEGYMNATDGYMDKTEEFMNAADSYMGTTKGYMETTDGYMKTSEEYMNNSNSYMGITEGYMNTANEHMENAKSHMENAEAYMNNAKTSETNAKASETASALSESNAKTSEANALVSETNAKTSETNAAKSESIALTSANNALTSETNAAKSEENANTYMTNADEYMKQTEEYKNTVLNVVNGLNSGFIPMGTITFAELATAEKATGFTYNISDDFVTDNNFAEGAGKQYTAGSNVYCRADGLWDCFGGAASPTATVDEVKEYLGI